MMAKSGSNLWVQQTPFFCCVPLAEQQACSLSNQRVIGYSQSARGTIAPGYQVCRSPLQMTEFVARLMTTILLWQHDECLPVPWPPVRRGKGQSGIGWASLHLMRYIRVVFSNEVLLSVSGEQQPWQQPELFGGSFGAPLVNSSTRHNSFLAVKVTLNGKTCLVGALSPYLFGDSISIPFIYIYIFFRCFYGNRLPYDSSNSPQYQLSLPVFPPLPLSSISLPV